MTIAPTPPLLSSQAPAEGSLHLLGEADAGGFDILLPGGVYALVPQSPPARFPLCSGFLKAAVTSGRVCHVLLRTDPSDFLDRLEHSGWPQAREAWQNESLRVYPMADGFSKLLFRRDVEGLTKELTHWGVASGDILLVDAGDELLSLHDLFMATGQLIKIRNWAKEQKVSMLLNFALAGAGSSMASLTGLMDHFSGMARLRSDSEGPVVTFDYWQSEWGTVAERTVLLASEAGELRVRLASNAFSNSNAVPTTVLAPETSLSVDRRKAMAEGAAPTPLAVTHGFFINEAMWGRELRMLTGTVWQAFSNIADIRLAANEVAASQIVLSFNQNTLISDLARDIHLLRAELHSKAHIVIAEHRMSLRYANELMLMKMGADAIIRQGISLERWPELLQSLKSQTPRLFEKLDVDVALASASSSREKGVLELPHFVAEVQAMVEKAQVLGVPFAMAVLRSSHVDNRSALLKSVNIRRTGDLLTTDGADVFVFFYACSLTMAPKVLAGVFDEELTRCVNEIDWMTSEHDIHNLIADLRVKQHTYKASTQANACAEVVGVASPADVSVADHSVQPVAAVPTDEASERATTTPTMPASEAVQLLSVPTQIAEDVDPRPTVHAPPLADAPIPERVTKHQWSRPNPSKLPSTPPISKEVGRAVSVSDPKAAPILTSKKPAIAAKEVLSLNSPKNSSDRFSADDCNRDANPAEDNSFVTDQRVVELIRRLALPAKIREQNKKYAGPNEPF